MTDKKTEALKLALEWDKRRKYIMPYVVRDAIREALAEQPAQQEPVAWQFFQGGKWHNGMEFNDHRKHTEAAGMPVRDLYPSPPASKPWVGLTQEDRVEIWKKSASIDGAINATITKLREKNNG